MWKLWKTHRSETADLELRVRALEAGMKAQDLEIDSLHTYVKSQLGRVDRKKALMEKPASATLTREEIVRRANGHS
jgi:hypothetical protein